MESSAATRNVSATPLGRRLRDLAERRPGVPVLSLYIDLDPARFGTQPARASAYTSVLDEAHRRIEACDTDHRGKMSLRADLDRARAFLRDFSPQGGGSGAAIFAADAAGLFEAFTLPRAARSQVVIDASPYVTPLVTAADMRDWLVVVLDSRCARFLRGNGDGLEELDRIANDVVGPTRRRGPSDDQRWVEHEVDANLKEVAQRLDEHLGRGAFACVLVGGPEESRTRLEAIMSHPAREKLAGRFEAEVDPDTASPEAIRRAALPCFQDAERRHEREVLDRLAERLGRGDRAVAGAADVLAMLEQARVETLLYDAEFDPPDPAVLEKAIEDTIAQSAEVLPVRHHAGELREHDDIAAVLRF
jgi:peptide subunit release factor 1 (eRF1)